MLSYGSLIIPIMNYILKLICFRLSVNPTGGRGRHDGDAGVDGALQEAAEREQVEVTIYLK